MTQASLFPTSVQSAHLPQVQSFDSPIFGSIRTLEKEGQPWFVAADICSALKYSNSSKAITDHVDSDDRYNESLERGGTATLINESGLYSLILRSRKTEAKQFKKWVTSEVLPSIRKHGEYKAPVTLTPSTPSDRAALKKLSDTWAKQTEQRYSQCYTQITAYFNLESFAELPVEWIPDAIAFVQARLDEHQKALRCAQQKALPPTINLDKEARAYFEKLRDLEEKHSKETDAFYVQAMKPFFHLVYTHEWIYDDILHILKKTTKDALANEYTSECRTQRAFKLIERALRLAH